MDLATSTLENAAKGRTQALLSGSGLPNCWIADRLLELSRPPGKTEKAHEPQQTDPSEIEPLVAVPVLLISGIAVRRSTRLHGVIWNLLGIARILFGLATLSGAGGSVGVLLRGCRLLCHGRSQAQSGCYDAVP